MFVKNTIISKIIIGLFLIMLTCWLPASGAENLSVTPVTTPFITIDPIGNHTVGDVFFVNGTTNLPSSEKLSVMVSLRTFQPGRQSFLTATVPILQGKNGVNSWSCNITPSTLWTIFKPFTYTFMAGVSSSMKYNVSNYSQTFDIYVDESNVSLVRSLMQTPAVSQTISPSLNYTPINTIPSSPTPATSLPLIIVFVAVVGIAMQQMLQRKKEE